MMTITATGAGALIGAMTPAERAAGRYMRAPDGHRGGFEGKSAAEMAEEVKGTLDRKFSEHDARLSDLEQKGARPRGGDGYDRLESMGEQFVNSQEFKSYVGADRHHSQKSHLALELKTITSATTGTGAAGAHLDPYRDAAVLIPQRRLRVRDLFSKINVSTGSVEYPSQTVRATGADVVAEGTLKPESDMQFELKTAPIRTIAHWVAASLQILDDAPQLAGIIDTELRYGLAVKEDAQLLNGSGSGQNLQGVNAVATAYAAPYALTGTPTKIDRIASALLQVTLADFQPDAIVVHPSDWLRMLLTKDSAQGYLLQSPVQSLFYQLWGYPVVATTSQAVGKFTVGQFKTSTLYDRWAPRVEVSTEHADFFVRNMCAIRVEERIGLANKQPKALVYGDYSADA